MIVCFIFTFLVLVEFCLVLALTRRNPLPRSAAASMFRSKDVRQSKDRDDDEDGIKKETVAATVEICFKVVMPALFCLFAMIFFMYNAFREESFQDRKDVTYEPISTLEVPI